MCVRVIKYIKMACLIVHCSVKKKKKTIKINAGNPIYKANKLWGYLKSLHEEHCCQCCCIVHFVCPVACISLQVSRINNVTKAFTPQQNHLTHVNYTFTCIPSKRWLLCPLTEKGARRKTSRGRVRFAKTRPRP